MIQQRNWAGNITFAASSLQRPASIDEVGPAVARADRVRVLGSAHSFNRIADTTGAQLTTADLPAQVEIDPDSATVTVNGGARYGEFVEQLDAAGWGLRNLASLPHISVAGAVATGTHGSGDGNRSLAGEVSAIESVIADGSTVSARRGDPEFDGMVVALGCLGVVTRITLDLVPAFELRQDVFEGMSWDRLLDDYDEITGSAYSVSCFTDWSDLGIALAWTKSRTDDTNPAVLEREFFGATRATHEHHPLPDLDASNTTAQLGAPGRWWNRLPHFKLGFTPSNGEEVQSEFLVPRRHAADAIDAVRAFGPRITPHLFVGELRTVAADELWLSPSHSEDCLALHFTWQLHLPEVEALVADIQAALAPFGARPHWGKVFDTAATDVAALYPRLDDFRALASSLDPDGKFRNDFVDQLLFSAD